MLENDNLWGDTHDLGDLPPILVERLRHYFSTYKLVPGEDATISIEEAYGAEHAFRVVQAARDDYDETFGGEP